MADPRRSKIPLRGIGKLFTHLPSGVRAKLEAAFSEAETQINYHNRSAINEQERRRISSYVSAPVITLTSNSRGFDVSWPRLEDRLISFYEAQVALTSNFADPTSYNLTETSLAVEGVGTTIYVRVRGVRWDGDTGNWSNTVTMSSTTGGPVTYSRGFDDVYPFYKTDAGIAQYPAPIQRLDITPQRQNGGIMIFGSIGANSVDVNNPAVVVTLNGVTVSQISDTDFKYIGNNDGNAGEHGCAFGPVFVSHDQFYFGDQESQTPNTIAKSGSHSSSGVHTEWNTAGSPHSYTVSWAQSHGIVTAQTNDINFTNFGFGVPVSNTIVGIQMTYTATDSNYGTGIYAEADMVHLKLIDDTGATRANKVGSLPAWRDSDGSMSFGGRSDLWGEVAGFWTPTKINDANFGVQTRGRVYAPSVVGFGTTIRTITMTTPTLIIYSVNETSGEVYIHIRFNCIASGNSELTSCTLNAIEFGDDL